MSRLALAVTPVALALCVLSASPAAAATTRYAAPTAPPKASECTDVADPCPLTSALDQAEAGDTISLLVGTYDVQATALPPLSLRWVPTDGRTRPKLTSSGAAPTIALGPAQSGSAFDGIEIDKATNLAETNGTPALQVGPGVTATVRSTVITGPVCVDAPDAGDVTIDESTLASPAGSTCARLGEHSTLRRSTVDRTDGIATSTPPPSVVSAGVAQDTDVIGGLQLVGPAAVARRVSASGWTAISGEGLVVDTVARATGSEGAAIAADAPRGGTLRVVNATAVATDAPALLARAVHSPTGPVAANVLRVSNSIARGGPSDIVAPSALTCALRQFCAFGEIAIDHSNFAVRVPAVGSTGASLITEGAGNQAGDPRFADARAGDLHLRVGSPAIDAGTAQDLALPVDLDGRSRVQGSAIDLGAYELAVPGGAGGLAGQGTGAVDARAPVLGRLRLLHPRFRVGGGVTAVAAGVRRVPVGTAVTTTTSESGRLTFAVQQRSAGRRAHGRCVAAARAPRKAARCTRWVARRPALTRRATSPGRVTLVFSGRVGARRLSAGRYRFAVTATDAAGNRSRVRRAAFTVVR